MFGAFKAEDPKQYSMNYDRISNESTDTESFFNRSQIDDETHSDHHGPKSSKKTGVFGTFLAIIKGYCALVVLILPKAYSKGGSAFSTFMLIASFVITTRCALKLI